MAYFFEVVLTATYFNQQIINVWNYFDDVLSPGNDPQAATLLSGLGWSEWDTITDGSYPTGSVALNWLNCVNPLFQLESVLVRDIYSVTNIAEWVFPPNQSGVSIGALTGEACSPAIAVGFNTNRVRTDVGRGQKRLSGQSELVFDAGGNINAAVAATRHNLLATAMSEPIPDGVAMGTFFQPAVFQKERYAVLKDGIPTGRFGYKYYENPTLQGAHTAPGVVWAVKPRQRFQISRQYGRGR